MSNNKAVTNKQAETEEKKVKKVGWRVEPVSGGLASGRLQFDKPLHHGPSVLNGVRWIYLSCSSFSNSLWCNIKFLGLVSWTCTGAWYHSCNRPAGPTPSYTCSCAIQLCRLCECVPLSLSLCLSVYLSPSFPPSLLAPPCLCVSVTGLKTTSQLSLSPLSLPAFNYARLYSEFRLDKNSFLIGTYTLPYTRIYQNVTHNSADGLLNH